MSTQITEMLNSCDTHVTEDRYNVFVLRTKGGRIELKISKKVTVFLGLLTLLNVGLPIAKASAAPVSPQTYWTSQQVNQNQTAPNIQPGQQTPNYSGYGYWYGPMHQNYWSGYNWNYSNGNNYWGGRNMGQWWCW